ncbi:MAG TPA: epoxyqueuosine reductase [Proteobacteria bacterium]|nr:epoxyqueuosine reductase [Pseudomonadota bacterium]
MDPGQVLIRKIKQCAERDPANRGEDGSRYFDTPLVGFASADDDLFTRYKSIIGSFHWTPKEVLAKAYGSVGPSARTVICWILPIVERTRLSNRKENRYPSRRWAHTRHYGEQFNDVLRKAVVDFLVERGGFAAAPMLMEEWSRVDDPEIGLASTWSERHAAFAAGLGTFSLSDGFITPRGIAHRIGSVVTDMVVTPSRQPYRDHRENCLTFRGLKCGECVTRCPVGAISLEGHDKALCHGYTYGPPFRELGIKFGVKHVGCGLCQTDVPCESRIPEGN